MCVCNEAVQGRVTGIKWLQVSSANMSEVMRQGLCSPIMEPHASQLVSKAGVLVSAPWLQLMLLLCIICSLSGRDSSVYPLESCPCARRDQRCPSSSVPEDTRVVCLAKLPLSTDFSVTLLQSPTQQPSARLGHLARLSGWNTA